jgi:hypothetical protein
VYLHVRAKLGPATRFRRSAIGRTRQRRRGPSPLRSEFIWKKAISGFRERNSVADFAQTACFAGFDALNSVSADRARERERTMLALNESTAQEEQEGLVEPKGPGNAGFLNTRRTTSMIEPVGRLT